MRRRGPKGALDGVGGGSGLKGRWWLTATAVSLCTITLLMCARSAGTPRHLLLITVDTLRADHLGCYGNTLGLTPNIDRFAGRSSLFTAAYASAPSTFPSVVGILTGQHPEKIGALNNYVHLSETVPTLATHLASRGWKTAPSRNP